MDKGVTAMRIVRGLKPADKNDFELYSNESLMAAFGKVADVISAGAFVISAIALLAAGVGIMNIMLVSVTERTKEIGIRKSIGARKNSILTQFLIEAVAISLAGGVLGILLGVGAGDAAGHVDEGQRVFPWDWAVLGLVVCSAHRRRLRLLPGLEGRFARSRSRPCGTSSSAARPSPGGFRSPGSGSGSGRLSSPGR